MSLSVCLLLLLIAYGLHCFRAKRAAQVCALTGSGLLLLAASGILPAVLLPLTQTKAPPAARPWQDRNSLVLLGAGTVPGGAGQAPDVPFHAYGRIVAAASAWRDCRAHAKDCNLIVSGGDPQHHGASEAQTYARTLMALGVPQSALVLEDRSRNTWQNAQFSTALIAPDRQIVVVTSGLHLKRSLIFFNHFRPGAQGIAADRMAALFGFQFSGYNLFLTDALLHEQLGLLQFHIYNLLGLNALPARPAKS
jgi:uncharacterized SAM-binding protein YcdF (DUF218 family)